MLQLPEGDNSNDVTDLATDAGQKGADGPAETRQCFSSRGVASLFQQGKIVFAGGGGGGTDFSSHFSNTHTHTHQSFSISILCNFRCSDCLQPNSYESTAVISQNSCQLHMTRLPIIAHGVSLTSGFGCDSPSRRYGLVLVSGTGSLLVSSGILKTFFLQEKAQKVTKYSRTGASDRRNREPGENLQTTGNGREKLPDLPQNFRVYNLIIIFVQWLSVGGSVCTNWSLETCTVRAAGSQRRQRRKTCSRNASETEAVRCL